MSSIMDVSVSETRWSLSSKISVHPSPLCTQKAWLLRITMQWRDRAATIKTQQVNPVFILFNEKCKPPLHLFMHLMNYHHTFILRLQKRCTELCKLQHAVRLLSPIMTKSVLTQEFYKVFFSSSFFSKSGLICSVGTNIPHCLFRKLLQCELH